jgi:hypothetical protein
MYYLISDAVVGTLILIVLIYLLLRIYNIKLADLFSLDGIHQMYAQKPWLIYLLLVIVIYVSFIIYNSICCNNDIDYTIYNDNNNNNNNMRHVERFIINNNISTSRGFISFDTFYNLYVMGDNSDVTIPDVTMPDITMPDITLPEIIPESVSESESEVEAEAEIKSEPIFEIIFNPLSSIHSETEVETEVESEIKIKPVCDCLTLCNHKAPIETVPKTNEITTQATSNRVIIFRTNIDGANYYLFMDSPLEDTATRQDLMYRKNNLLQPRNEADDASICRISGNVVRYVGPALIREDLLMENYKHFLQTACSVVQKEVMYKKQEASVSHGNKKCSNLLNNDNIDNIDNDVNTNIVNIINNIDNIDNDVNTNIVNTNATHPNVNVNVTNAGDMTQAQKILHKTIYPRYLQHFYVTQHSTSDEQVDSSVLLQIPNETLSSTTLASLPATSSILPSTLTAPIASLQQPHIPPARQHIMERSKFTEPYFYRFNAIIADQTENILDTTTSLPYTLSATKSFSPFTILRKKKIITNTVDDNGIEKANITEVDILNDKKFICGVRSIGVPDKYASIFVETKLTLSDQVSKISHNHNVDSETESQILKIRDTLDRVILKGYNNTNINNMETLVNLYVYGDIKNSNNVPITNVKYYIARLDTYTDPVAEAIAAGNTNINTTNNATTSILKDMYKNKPRMYPVGLIPHDYIQCNTVLDKTGILSNTLEINSACNGITYIDGVDYSDARKIDFEVISVILNPL